MSSIVTRSSNAHSILALFCPFSRCFLMTTLTRRSIVATCLDWATRTPATLPLPTATMAIRPVTPPNDPSLHTYPLCMHAHVVPCHMWLHHLSFVTHILYDPLYHFASSNLLSLFPTIATFYEPIFWYKNSHTLGLDGCGDH